MRVRIETTERWIASLRRQIAQAEALLRERRRALAFARPGRKVLRNLLMGVIGMNEVRNSKKPTDGLPPGH